MLTITVDPGWNGAVALFENNKLLYKMIKIVSI